jgi:hypothetical protein
MLGQGRSSPYWHGICFKQAVLESQYMKQNTMVRGIEVVTVGETSVFKALARVVACQGCTPSVSRAFGSVLAEVLGAGVLMTEYIVTEAVACPNCNRPMFENTLVRCEGEREEYPAETFKEFEPNWEETNVVLIDEGMVAEAQACISGCEHCVANTETTFDYVLDAVTNCDPAMTEYLLCGPAKCPRCGHEVTEKTFVA